MVQNWRPSIHAMHLIWTYSLVSFSNAALEAAKPHLHWCCAALDMVGNGTSFSTQMQLFSFARFGSMWTWPWIPCQAKLVESAN